MSFKDIESTDSLSEANESSGLTISIKKTKVMFQPAKASTANMSEIKIVGKVLTMLTASHILIRRYPTASMRRQANME